MQQKEKIKHTSLLEKVTRQWKLCCNLIEASVQAAKCLNMRFIFLYRYDFSKASFKIVYCAVGSFKSRDIRSLLRRKCHKPYFQFFFPAFILIHEDNTNGQYESLTCDHEPCRVIIQSPAMNKFGKDVEPRIMSLYEPVKRGHNREKETDVVNKISCNSL